MLGRCIFRAHAAYVLIAALFLTVMPFSAFSQISGRPSFPQTTSDSFDAASVTAYRGSHPKA